MRNPFVRIVEVEKTVYVDVPVTRYVDRDVPGPTEYIDRYPEAEARLEEAIEKLKMMRDLELAPKGTPERVRQLKDRQRLVQIQLDEAKLALRS